MNQEGRLARDGLLHLSVSRPELKGRSQANGGATNKLVEKRRLTKNLICLASLMPKMLDLDGFQVFILLPPREHPPAHVHVYRAGTEVMIFLNPVSVREVNGMRNADVVRAVGIVLDHLDELRAKWKEIHR